jgi:hypothetical protein
MVWALCILAACRPQAVPSTPAAAATAVRTPTPAVTPVPTVDAAVADIQDEFLSNVNDLTSDVETLATATCADLIKETRANPAEVQQMRGFAATLQRAGTSQTALDSDDVRSALGDLGKALSQLDAALSTCGIQP